MQAWYRQNLQIAIPVTIIAALIVLALLWALIRGSLMFYYITLLALTVDRNSTLHDPKTGCTDYETVNDSHLFKVAP